MKQEYIQSTEDYKGFTLEIKMFCLDEKIIGIENVWYIKTETALQPVSQRKKQRI